MAAALTLCLSFSTPAGAQTPPAEEPPAATAEKNPCPETPMAAQAAEQAPPVVEDPCTAYMHSYPLYQNCQDRYTKIQKLKAYNDAKRKAREDAKKAKTEEKSKSPEPVEKKKESKTNFATDPLVIPEK
jgi:hypothetical protein